MKEGLNLIWKLGKLEVNFLFLSLSLSLLSWRNSRFLVLPRFLIPFFLEDWDDVAASVCGGVRGKRSVDLWAEKEGRSIEGTFLPRRFLSFLFRLFLLKPDLLLLFCFPLSLSLVCIFSSKFFSHFPFRCWQAFTLQQEIPRENSRKSSWGAHDKEC